MTKNKRKNIALYAPQWVSRKDLPQNDFDEILPGLIMGGTQDGDTVDFAAELPYGLGNHTFDAVATLYAWAQPMGWGVEEMRLGIYDSEMDPAFISNVMRLARWTHERWSEGGRVLVRCQAGMNRSGLVTALALMIEGHSAEEAISMIRNARGKSCLFNNHFVDWLINEADEHVRPLRSPSAA